MKIFWNLASTIIILGLVSLCKALICYECLRAKDDEDCMKKAILTECKNNQESCQVEIRKHKIFGFKRMTKRCKQARACHNNHLQNWVNPGEQCEAKSLFVSVCRCCCIKDLCNVSTMETCTGVTDPSLLKERVFNPECDPIGDINHGAVKCTDGFKPGSSCRIFCSSGYDIYGRQTISCQRVHGVNGKMAVWSSDKPCCTRPCPPHAMMDLIVAIDATSSTPADWNMMKQFVVEVLAPYNIGQFESQVGVIIYNEKVKYEKEILLKDYHDRGELLRAIQEIEIDFKSKGGIRPGRALKHAAVKSFSEGNGNRDKYRDVMLCFRMGVGLEENMSPEIPAKGMEDNGITLITVGIGENTNMEEILLTVSSADKAIHVKEGLYNYKFYINAIRRAICGPACSR